MCGVVSASAPVQRQRCIVLSGTAVAIRPYRRYQYSYTADKMWFAGNIVFFDGCPHKLAAFDRKQQRAAAEQPPPRPWQSELAAARTREQAKDTVWALWAHGPMYVQSYRRTYYHFRTQKGQGRNQACSDFLLKKVQARFDWRQPLLAQRPAGISSVQPAKTACPELHRVTRCDAVCQFESGHSNWNHNRNHAGSTSSPSVAPLLTPPDRCALLHTTSATGSSRTQARTFLLLHVRAHLCGSN
eukprot:COSAG01_NODE_14677_length_1422_cov_17.049131_2_plen_243_part_00